MTSQPDSRITVICPECGEIIEVNDPQALLLSLHQTATCEALASLMVKTDG